MFHFTIPSGVGAVQDFLVSEQMFLFVYKKGVVFPKEYVLTEESGIWTLYIPKDVDLYFVDKCNLCKKINFEYPDLPSDKKTTVAFFALDNLIHHKHHSCLKDRVWAIIFQYEIAKHENNGKSWEDILNVGSHYMFKLVLLGFDIDVSCNDYDPYYKIFKDDIKYELSSILSQHSL